MRAEDLRNRTKAYASGVIRFYSGLPKNREEIRVLGHQLLRSGTSVAANFREASRARSDAEFLSKISICIQEADESCLWFELLKEDCGIADEKLDRLLNESNELIAIFVTMVRKTKDRLNK